MLKFINPYIFQMKNFPGYIFEEEEVKKFKGQWREKWGVTSETPLDLEIGTGNGFHFAHYAQVNPERKLVGIEIKYKPMVQALKRARANNSTNIKIVRGDANNLKEIFSENEINKIIIHHPDPWPKRKQQKNRIIQKSFLENLYEIMKPGGFLDFKTDHAGYFVWATRKFIESPFKLVSYTEDLHNSLWASENYITHFEKMYIAKGQPIYFCRVQKP